MTGIVEMLTGPKIAVVGCGYWGKNLVRNLSQLGVLASICDVNTAAALAISKEFNIPALTLDEVLASDADGIMVAVPSPLHFSVAQQALTVGKHVFVEKPLTLAVYEAQLLEELAKRNSRVLMVGHIHQYHPAFMTLKHMVLQGELGQLQYIHANRLNLGRIRCEENVLFDFAPHDISMILALTQELPRSVYASGISSITANVQDIANAHLEFNDMQAHITVSWLHPYKEHKLTVIGTKGMAVFDDCQDWDAKLKLFANPIQWQDGIPYAKPTTGVSIPIEVVEPLKQECRHFVESIIHNAKPRTDVKEAIKVLKILTAAQESIITKTAVYLPIEEPTYYKNTIATIA